MRARSGHYICQSLLGTHVGTTFPGAGRSRVFHSTPSLCAEQIEQYSVYIERLVMVPQECSYNLLLDSHDSTDRTIHQLWQAHQLCDTVVVTGDDQQVPCHRLVLAGASGFFRALFLGAGTSMKDAVERDEQGRQASRTLQLLLLLLPLF